MADVLSQESKAGILNYTFRSLSKQNIHCISAAVVDIALYSASVELLDIVFYFFDFHETNDSPMKMQYHVIDFLVCLQLPLSESMYAMICISDVDG